MVEVLKIARNGSLPTSVVVWGDSMEAFFDKEAGAGGALSRTTEYLRLRDQEIIPGLLPRDVISVDSASIDDGVLVFRVDEEHGQAVFTDAHDVAASVSALSDALEY